jgi:hypothetical protein
MEHFPLVHAQRDFLSLTLLAGLAILAYVRTTYPVRWNWVWRAAISTSYPYERDDRYWLNNFNLWMWIVFLIAGGSFIYIGQDILREAYFSYPLSNIFFFWGAIALLYLVKFGSIYFISVLFKMPRAITRFIVPRFASIHISGVVMLLAAIIALYLPKWNSIGIYAGIGIALSLLIFGLLRQVYGLMRGQRKLVWLYIILYICTLEIAPLIFLFDLGLKV